MAMGGRGKADAGGLGWGGQEHRRGQMPPSLESILSSWREKLPDIKEKEPQTAEYGVCTRGALDGEGVWSTWVGVLEEGQLRLGLQAGSCPKGTHI